MIELKDLIYSKKLCQHEKPGQERQKKAIYIQQEDSSYFLINEKNFKHTFPLWELQYNLATQRKISLSQHLFVMRASCHENSHPTERSLKNDYLESGVIISFDTTFTVRFLNPPEMLQRDKSSTCSLYTLFQWFL